MYMVCTIMKNHKRVSTWYVHGMYTGNRGYKHVCMYMFIHLHTYFESYKHVHTVYRHVYARFVYLMYRVQMATYIS